MNFSDPWFCGTGEPNAAELWKIAKVIRRHCGESIAWAICAKTKDQWYYFHPYKKIWVPSYQEGGGIICGFSDEEFATDFLNKHKPKLTLKDVPCGFRFEYLSATVIKTVNVSVFGGVTFYMCVDIKNGVSHYVEETYVIE